MKIKKLFSNYFIILLTYILIPQLLIATFGNVSPPDSLFEEIISKKETDLKINYESYRLIITKELNIKNEDGKEVKHSATDLLEVSKDGNFHLKLENLYNKHITDVLVYGKRAFVSKKSQVTGEEKIIETDQIPVFINWVNKLATEWISIHEKYKKYLVHDLSKNSSEIIQIDGSMNHTSSMLRLNESKKFKQIEENIIVNPENKCLLSYKLDASWNKTSKSGIIETSFKYLIKIEDIGKEIPIANLNLKPIKTPKKLNNADNPTFFTIKGSNDH
ncbi:MAG: hypothetical protein ABIA04_03435 [Pseudomonadota bacterium]